MLNKADIHIHTTFSDGLMTPEAVVEYVATETDLRVIAITDHDTIEGAVAARRYQRRHQRENSGTWRLSLVQRSRREMATSWGFFSPMTCRLG